MTCPASTTETPNYSEQKRTENNTHAPGAGSPSTTQLEADYAMLSARVISLLSPMVDQTCWKICAPSTTAAIQPPVTALPED